MCTRSVANMSGFLCGAGCRPVCVQAGSDKKQHEEVSRLTSPNSQKTSIDRPGTRKEGSAVRKTWLHILVPIFTTGAFLE